MNTQTVIVLELTQCRCRYSRSDWNLSCQHPTQWYRLLQYIDPPAKPAKFIFLSDDWYWHSNH